MIDEKVLIERLEELQTDAIDKWDGGASHRAYSKSIEIVNQIAEEQCHKFFCDDCETYNKEEHYCPKWCNVIEHTVKEMEEQNNGWIIDRNPTKEECGRYGSGWFLATVQQHEGNKTIPMQYEYTTIRGKEVARWMWYGRIASVEPIAWQPLPAPYQTGE